MRYLIEKADVEWRPGRLLQATNNVALEYWHSKEERNNMLNFRMVERGTSVLILKLVKDGHKAEIMLLVGQDVLKLSASDGAHDIPFRPLTERIVTHAQR